MSTEFDEPDIVVVDEPDIHVVSVGEQGPPGINSSPIIDNTLVANISGATAVPAGHTLTEVLDALAGATPGAILRRTASAWAAEHSDLSAIADLTSAADKLPYATGAGTWAMADFTAFGRSIAAAANASAAIILLGLGSMSIQNAGAVTITGGTAALSTLSTTGALTVQGAPSAFGTAASSNTVLTVGSNLLATPLTGGIQFGLSLTVVGNSSATTRIGGVYARADTAAAAFTCPELRAFDIDDAVKGAGSSITLQVGLNIRALGQGGTIYSLRSQTAAAANRWNLFIDGTASNWLAGDTILGATKKFYLDGVVGAGSDTYITESSANVLDMYAGAANTLRLTATGAKVTGTMQITSLGAFAASDKYVIVDSNGNFHVSALGPAS